jgi:hypothetical protein
LDKTRKTSREKKLRAKQKRQMGEASMTPAEVNVLRAFRKYLMTPREMLCFGSSDLEAFHVPLARLTNEGFLVAERFHGGYSLTETGYAAMKELGSDDA